MSKRFDDLDWRPAAPARRRTFEAQLAACCIAAMLLLAVLTALFG